MAILRTNGITATRDCFFDEVTRLEEAGELDAMIQAAGERHHHFDLR